MINTKRILLALLALGMVTVLLISCGPASRKGAVVPNVAPQIRWADIPIDSTRYTMNPTIKWWGTDKDGQIEAYRYSILLADYVNSNGGPDAIINSFPDTATWTELAGNISQTKVFLYSSQDTSVYIDQFVFMRAIDDDNASSSTIYLLLSRKNHPPTCRVVLPDSTQWCLPESTSRWQGITIAWDGKDSLDYPGLQPDFQWQVRAYGPFADSASADTLPAHLYWALIDEQSHSDWTMNKSTSLINFVTGYYMIYARNRDDALVPAEVPATGVISVFEPQWIRNSDFKKILLVEHSRYATNRPGELRSIFADSVREFYTQLLDSAGYSPSEYDWYSTNGTLLVDKDILYNYRMVMAVNIDAFLATDPSGLDTLYGPVSTDQRAFYKAYLNVGGMLWVVGRRSFENPLAGASSDGQVNFASTSLQHRYLDLISVNTPKRSEPLAAEFSGAISILPGFEDIYVDTLRVSYTSTASNHYAEALRGVETLVRGDSPEGLSETIYLYRAINPDTSRYANLPAAIRFTTTGYKTSYFSFPLYFMEKSQAVAVTRRMLDWFLNPVQ